MSRIRILLIGVTGMLNEIVRAAIASESDMTIVDARPRGGGDLGALTRQRRIDVVIYSASDFDFDADEIAGMLKANPRVSWLAVDGPRDSGALHRMAPTRESIGRLTQSSLANAVRVGASLRTR